MKQTRILLIDDDPFFMRQHIDYLKAEEFDVLHITSVESALQAAESGAEAFDVVILDIMMPPGKYGKESTEGGIRTGIRLLEELRKLLPVIPIIVLTFTPEFYNVQERIESKVTVCLRKPILPSELVSWIRTSTKGL